MLFTTVMLVDFRFSPGGSMVIDIFCPFNFGSHLLERRDLYTRKKDVIAS